MDLIKNINPNELLNNQIIIDDENEEIYSNTSNISNTSKYSEYLFDSLSQSNIKTKSKNDWEELELIESKIPKELSKEKKMSLLIVVLLQMIFMNDNTKLEKIYDFLNKKKILDIDVTKKKYFGLRQNLSKLIGSINNSNNYNSTDIDKYNFNKTNTDVEFYKQHGLDKLIIQTNTNKYRMNFNQIKLLGQGSYGSVYKVFHKFEKKFYAIKKIFITNDMIVDDYDIFREIQIYSDLSNENVVRYYSSWVDIDFQSMLEYNEQINNDDEFEPIDYVCPILFIQMELCDFTLKDYLMTFSLTDSIENKISLILQIINGLEYLRTKNIIHRDIKPDNIFLIHDNTYNKYIVKLGDFGLCKKYLHNKLTNLELEPDMDSNNITNNICEINQKLDPESITLENHNLLSNDVGTGIYRAPEIKTGIYDFTIDIYSLGIIILELFVNFTTQSEKIFTISKIIKKDYWLKTNNKLFNNKIIENIVMNCLSFVPTERSGLDFIKKSLGELL
jgi:hypothetical protein